MISGTDPEEKIVYEPLGVICNISAWNYPYLVGINVFVPALIAGNAVMYKPSEFATLTGMEIGKLLKEAGIPELVFQLALGGGAVGEALLHIPFDGYFFTGSYKTGKSVYEKASLKMVPVSANWEAKILCMLLTILKTLKQWRSARQMAHFIITDRVVVR